jgi:Holliday junction resolvase
LEEEQVEEVKKKGKNHGRLGTKNEFKTIGFLERRGFVCCRSSGSHGTQDVMGLYASDPENMVFASVYIQSKSNTKISRQELENLRIMRNQFEISQPGLVLVAVFNWHTATLRTHSMEDMIRIANTPVITRLGATKAEDHIFYM